MKYMSYVLYPFLVCYVIYTYLYGEKTESLYTFILQSLVGFIYTFGFIEMTPQLYINYKLQSVEHMP